MVKELQELSNCQPSIVYMVNVLLRVWSGYWQTHYPHIHTCTHAPLMSFSLSICRSHSRYFSLSLSLSLSLSPPTHLFTIKQKKVKCTTSYKITMYIRIHTHIEKGISFICILVAGQDSDYTTAGLQEGNPPTHMYVYTRHTNCSKFGRFFPNE